jgi:hypothetical protein
MAAVLGRRAHDQGRKTVEIDILADPQRPSRVDLTFRQLTAARQAGTLEQLEVTPLLPGRDRMR